MTERYDGDSEESRRAFRDYDLDESVASKTPWQVWRDACAWQAQAAMSVCADGGKGEAVYQVQTGDCWLDMTQEQYERHSKTRPTRVLYTAPQAECAPDDHKAWAEDMYRAFSKAECAPLCDHEWEAMTLPHKECAKCGDVRRDWKAPRETQPEKNHIETMVHNAKIIQALHVARYALVTHSGCRMICEGVSRTMDFELELNQVDEVMTMLGVDLTEPLPAPVEWDSKDGDDE